MKIKNLVQFSNIDVRSEKEFNKGTIPGSVNFPILIDSHFEQIGKEYKNKGKEAAVTLGFKLVNGDFKENLINSWENHIFNNPGCLVFCYRGGMRSQIALEWLSKRNIIINRLEKGYKKFRSNILAQHQDKNKYKKDWIIIGGLTGSGKTEFIKGYKENIDLEDIANHRGSAFGRKKTNQPTQANFENILTAKYLDHQFPQLLLEDESRTIGRAGLPGCWYEKMQISKLVVIEIEHEERLENIYDEYIYQEIKIINDEEELFNKYSNALDRIKRRLGNSLHGEIREFMTKGFGHNDKEAHKKWISILLTNYYDKMYNYKLGIRQKDIVHRGSKSSCQKYLKSIIKE